MFRYERKFVSNKIDEILKTDLYLSNNKVLQLHRPYKSRFIHNIYFDDYCDSSLYENLNGSQFKKKIRLRWYDNNKELCRLEMKGKNADYGSKKVWKIKLPKSELNNFLNNDYPYLIFINLIKKNNPDLDDYIIEVLKSIRPVSYNNYFREYFVDFSNLVRVTIDKELKFYNWRGGMNDLLHFNPGLVIYEVKFSSIDSLAIKTYDEFIKEFPLRVTKFSKFAYSSYSEDLVL